MDEGDLDFLGQGHWRKRIHQIKQGLRSSTSEPSLVIPEQIKPYGTELRPKRDLDRVKTLMPKRAIASAPLP